MPRLVVARTFAAAALAIATLTGTATPASAQSTFWDWGGEKKVDGSGRQVVKLRAAVKPGQIIVSFSDRKLYFVTKPGEALSYPIAVPRDESRWQGMTTVTAMRENPSWTPTPTMRKENPKLPNWVPGGHPMNPLGQRALYLGSSAYRIHGTDAPWTIGSAVSKGCVRMYNQDAADLYTRARVGASVQVTWEKFDAKLDAEADAVLAATEPTKSDKANAEAKSERKSTVQTGSIAMPEKPKSAAAVSKPLTSSAPKRAEAATPADAAEPTTPKAKPAAKPVVNEELEI